MTKHKQTNATKRARAPHKAASKATKTTAAKRSKKATKPKPKRARDPRLPVPGSTLVREYKGRAIRVSVLEEGFRWERKEYRSLSALAAAITGAKSINGFLWFKLTDAKRATPKRGKSASASTEAAAVSDEASRAE